MKARERPLGLIVRQAPYAQRDPRAQLDVALAAAALELPLEIYFVGDGVWQLARQHQSAEAGLPRGLKGWAAVAEMTHARFYAEAECWKRLEGLGGEAIVPLQALGLEAMSQRWLSCLKVMAL